MCINSTYYHPYPSLLCYPICNSHIPLLCALITPATVIHSISQVSSYFETPNALIPLYIPSILPAVEIFCFHCSAPLQSFRSNINNFTTVAFIECVKD